MWWIRINQEFILINWVLVPWKERGEQGMMTGLGQKLKAFHGKLIIYRDQIGSQQPTTSPKWMNSLRKDPKISGVPLSLLASAGSHLAPKRAYFSGSCRLSCSQGLARAVACPLPSGDEKLQIDLGSMAIFPAFFIPCWVSQRH